MSAGAGATDGLRHGRRIRPYRVRRLSGPTGLHDGRARPWPHGEIAENERLQARLRKGLHTAAGRAALRERTVIEHKLAHIAQRQGTHARYRGVRKNTFDLRRASAIQNLETIHLAEVESQKVA
jgi:hypothetical protein